MWRESVPQRSLQRECRRLIIGGFCFLSPFVVPNSIHKRMGMFGEKRKLMAVRCCVCRKWIALRVDPDDLERHRNKGVFVQRAFVDRKGRPYRTPHQRELFLTKKESQLSAQKQDTMFITSKDGKTKIVGNVQTTSTTSKDGSVTTTQVFTAAGFSNGTGKFDGAGQETVTTVTNADGTSTTSTSSKDISYGQAALTIGAGNLAEAQS